MRATPICSSARRAPASSTSHAYLFLGSPGSGKLDAAWALAQALLCGEDGVSGACASCDDCGRAARRTHPDVHYFAPESATGYLIAQTRELLEDVALAPIRAKAKVYIVDRAEQLRANMLEDVALAPIRAKAKVYIVDRAEQLRANTANALLKTLEEPPAGVTFILLGSSADVMLPTIVSRCQCVPFRPLSLEDAATAVEHATGLPAGKCRMAVAVAGSPARAVEFLKSGDRQAARRAMVRAVDLLAHADEADILAAAAGVTFILLGSSADVMLPTIVSRCQCVPFRPLSLEDAATAVEHATGLPAGKCRMAVAVAGSPARAVEFLKSGDRQAARRAMVRAVDLLAHADEADILAAAKDLMGAIKAPLAEVKSTQQAVLEQNQDYLSRGALKQLADRIKRELNARERSGIMEALASVRSLLRDALVRLASESEPVVNEDVSDVVVPWFASHLSRSPS